MIKFKTLRMKNIFSYGNVFTEIPLDSHKSTLVVGVNGAGKSSFIEALTFGLYGKPYRKVKLGQMVNSVNGKDLLVEVEFEIGGSSFMVRRGIKPNKFEIYKDGEMLKQDGSASDYQSMLENEILKMSYRSYGQIVVLGTATFTPFMQLAAKDRREFIESLIGLEVFSSMNEMLKSDVKDNKEAISENKHEIEIAEVKQKASLEKKALIEANQETKKVEIKNNIKKNVDQVEEINSKIDSLREEMVEVDEDKIESLTKKKEKLEDYQRIMTSKVRSHEKDKDFFHENDNCPTCKQIIQDLHKSEIIEGIDDKISDMEDGIKKIGDQLAAIEDELKPLLSDLQDRNTTQGEISDLEIQRNIYLKALKDLKNDLDQQNAPVKQDKDETNWDDVLNGLRNDRNALLKQREVLNAAAGLLKDGGMKATMIKKYVPMINASVNQYLSTFEFYADFNLDENFDETIRSQYRDVFSYNSFSQGEKAKIDISLMLTWRAIAKRRNSVATNLLILDEVFDGSTDSEGVENMKKILNEEDTSYIVVSHKSETHESHFDRVLQARKEKNFTILEEAGDS